MGKKTKKAKLPKEVMGVKLPREVREIGGALLEKAQSPQGREMLAAGLTMAAAAATAAVAKGRAKREAAAAASDAPAAAPSAAEPEAPTPPVPPVPPQGTQMQPDPQAIAEAVGKAAEAMLGRLFGGKKA
ncbi:F0F1-type ATP synthase membrane subunit c/vacuolar-type H+-ATPase subunit K [Sphingomonas insulae]|uniref:Uncharacterized protein n=1 Tax=Sphingomonas insulae TaxID=424800 RepID=A0ABN1HZV2_9SPHN|nr:hypothetical protein [Sphingomonas insulae]NIJ30608.1 F0F1-type ATP synthase membrane subunit c/vacuolar-type H+-ATPase subunit K [Sphingomonas insulae]